MLKLLSQISASILAVGFGFLATYIVYLYANQNSLTTSIEQEGFKIAVILEKYISKGGFSFEDVGNKLLRYYSKKYPKASTLDLITYIKQDVESRPVQSYTKVDSDKFNSILNDSLPYAGRFMVFSLNQYIDALLPPGKRRVGLGYTVPYRYDKIENSSDWLFPFGINGLEQWLKEYQRIKISVQLFKRNFEFYGEDLKNLRRSNLSKSYSKSLYKVNFEERSAEILEDVESMYTFVMRIHSLKRMREQYSINNKLPHLKYIVSLLIGIFVIGILLPLTLAALNIGENNFEVYNIVILLSTISLIFISGQTIYKDISRQDRTREAEATISELKYELEYINAMVEEFTPVRYDYLNEFASGPYREFSSEPIISKVEELSNLVANHNSTLESTIGLIKNKINRSEFISPYIDHSCSEVNVMELFMNILVVDDLQKIFLPNKYVTMHIGEMYNLNGRLCFRTPKEPERYLEFINEMKNIKKELLRDKNISNMLKVKSIVRELNTEVI